MNDVAFIFRPLDESTWQHDGKGSYECCRFRAGYSDTIAGLKYELGRLGSDQAVIEIDVTEDDIRLDGLPRANARPRSPKVRLSFEHPGVGPLQYPCATFESWQDNLRAIVKTLEAQRAMDRYGATRHAQQYRGWRALPGGEGPRSEPTTVGEAAAVVNSLAGSPTIAADIANVVENYRLAYREAARRCHPDTGGSTEAFKRLQEARRVLDKHHGLR